MAGLVKRRLYRPDRIPERKRGVIGKASPVSVPDATPSEVLTALSAVALQAGVKVGRGGVYDQIRDRYTVVGKSLLDGKALDIDIDGGTVGEVILACRMMRSGAIDPVSGHLLSRPDSGGIVLL